MIIACRHDEVDVSSFMIFLNLRSIGGFTYAPHHDRVPGGRRFVPVTCDVMLLVDKLTTTHIESQTKAMTTVTQQRTNAIEFYIFWISTSLKIRDGYLI